MNHVGNLIKKYRIKQNLTQQQLGDILKLSSAFICSVESGLKNFPVRRSQDLAKALGLDIGLLIDAAFADNKKQIEQRVKKLKT